MLVNLYAESNRIFVGAGAGFINRGQNVNNNSIVTKYSDNDAFTGVVFKYKHYIGNTDFGLRYYISADTSLVDDNKDLTGASWQDYDLNIDMLYNFTSNKSFISFGALVCFLVDLQELAYTTLMKAI